MINHKLINIKKCTLFGKIQIERPTDKIVQEIKKSIDTGKLMPGDQLPSIRHLTESFGVGSGYIREALKQLEYLGILEIKPQIGTVVKESGVNGFNSVISHVIKLESKDFNALVETRELLEVNAVSRVAKHITASELQRLEETHQSFCIKADEGSDALEEDLAFHVLLADLSRNTVIASLIRILIPEVARLSRKLQTCKDENQQQARAAHTAIMEAIKARNETEAKSEMKKHIQSLYLK